MDATHREVRGYLPSSIAPHIRGAPSTDIFPRFARFPLGGCTRHAESDPVSVLQGPKAAKRLPRVISAAEMVKLLGAYEGSEEPEDMRNKAILEFLCMWSTCF
ncbi:MAG: hypothetical protein ACLTQI_00380 [Slackia sp.]